jgi:hypothetical protein
MRPTHGLAQERGTEGARICPKVTEETLARHPFFNRGSAQIHEDTSLSFVPLRKSQFTAPGPASEVSNDRIKFRREFKGSTGAESPAFLSIDTDGSN